MSELKRHELRAYVKAKDYKLLETEANSRGLSMSKTVRDCLAEYLNIRQELATAVETPGEAGDPHTGKIIHTLLARTEERIAATIERLEAQAAEQQEQLHLVTAMLDRLYLGVMQHMPKVPEELADGLVASAKRRHGRWLKAVERLLSE